MKKKFKRTVACVLLFFSAVSLKSYSQMTITGPQCATSGTIFQYIISGATPGAQSMQICVSGGVIAGTDSTCYNGAPVSYIRIKWGNVTQGTLAISGAVGNASLQINIAKLLTSGNIDSMSRRQVIKTGLIPVVIFCAPATGGNCSPRYTYQWQGSADGIHWSDIAGAISKDLRFSGPLLQTMYYRRKSTESKVHTDSYSDIAIVLVTQ